MSFEKRKVPFYLNTVYSGRSVTPHRFGYSVIL